ncbi:MAG: GNAT family N-acetyltransferase [Planctomycetaceae bacterium]
MLYAPDRFNPHWLCARAAKLEGTFPSTFLDSGGWTTTVNRVIHGWGNVTYGNYPWDPRQLDAGPPPDPEKFDEFAKEYRSDFSSRIWDAFDCIQTTHRQAVPCATFYVTQQWKNPPEGRLHCIQDESDILGAHSVMMVPPPYVDVPCPLSWAENEFLVFQNSWGEEWGNRGYGAMTFDFFNKYMYEAWALESHLRIPNLYGSGIQHVQWQAKAADRMFLAYDIIDVDSDERLAWASAVVRRGELHLEELYVKPQYRNRGYGSQMLKKFISEGKSRLRLWIPFADVDSDEKTQILEHFLWQHGLSLRTSPRKWAAFCAVIGPPEDIRPSFVLPPKATYTFCKQSEAVADAYEGIRHNESPALQEHDMVRFVVDIPEVGVAEGQRGTIVHLYEDGNGVEVEIVTPSGVDVITAERSQLKQST